MTEASEEERDCTNVLPYYMYLYNIYFGSCLEHFKMTMHISVITCMKNLFFDLSE